MKKTTKLIASVLALASMISAASCSGGDSGGRSAGGNEASNAENTTAATTAATSLTTPETRETDEGVQNAVQDVDLGQDSAELNVTKKLRWLAWWPIDETSPEAELFKTNYGIPEEGDQSYGDEAGNISTFTNVAYADRYDKLGQMVSAGDSPDMFPFEIGYFPLSAYKGMFQSIDGVVDTYSEEWADTRADMDKFMWGGKNYCAITKINTGGLWWYKRTTMEEAGLPDPYELYRAGEWDWNAFLDMADKFQQTGENKFAVDGWAVSEDLVATSGTPLVSIENGKLVSNLTSPAVERAMTLAETLCTQNYRYDRATLNSWSVNYKAWANGDTLFFDEGTWFWEDNMWKYKMKYGWDDDEVFFVPAPRDPASDTYYQALKQDAYMFVAGSDNADGFAAWTKCVLAAAKDENVKAAAREKEKKDRLWTDEMLDFVDELSSTLVGVWDFKNGISTAAANTSAMEASPVESLLKIPYVTGTETYTQLRSEKQGEITTAIDELNASVS